MSGREPPVGIGGGRDGSTVPVSTEEFRGAPAFEAADVQVWRTWLSTYAASVPRVWLVLYRQHAKRQSVGYVEAVEQALCFGWIDSQTHKRDADSTYQQFTPRNPRSTWSESNRERVERLTRLGQMREAGQAMIDLAHRTGTWWPYPEADAGVVPADLAEALAARPPADTHFAAFPLSSRRLILVWIAEARRPETRAKRIAETVAAAERNLRAHHPGVRVEPDPSGPPQEGSPRSRS